MTDAQKWLILTGVFLTGVLLYLLAPVLTPAAVIVVLLRYLYGRYLESSLYTP